jgi:hypothetical protein
MELEDIKSNVNEKWEETRASGLTGTVGRVLGGIAGILLLIIALLGFIWDSEPDLEEITVANENTELKRVTGTTTVTTLIDLTDIMLNKTGGYLTNDILPPGAWMDNIPNWELGVVVQIRDMVRTLRNTLSRSQSQSAEDLDLVNAEQNFFFDNNRWFWPDTEGKFQAGIRDLENYRDRLANTRHQDAQFYARADNLRTWLSEVETRLGSLSQRLSSSVGKRQLDISLAGDSAATRSTSVDEDNVIKTPWTELDDVFYEARGTTWALIHLLKAVEVDFEDVLRKKNAVVSLQQIIRELEPTQDTVWSPVILNGSGFGFVANHSLVMASHISRANAAIIDLRNLLEQG